MTRIATAFGGPSPEHDVSVSTGLQASRVLPGSDCLYWSLTGDWYLIPPGLELPDFADGVPRKARRLELVAAPGGGYRMGRKRLEYDALVNCFHGGPGEDGTVQGIWDMAGLCYTGPGQGPSSLGMDKLIFAAAVRAAGMPTLERRLVTPRSAPDFDPPYIMKPRSGGSSIGIVIVDDYDTALAVAKSSPHMAEGAVIEPYLEGAADLQIAVRRYPAVEVSAIEEPVRSDRREILTYQEKYLAWGDAPAGDRRIPADLPDSMETTIQTQAMAVADLVGIRGVSRVDFLSHDGNLYVNEINTLPGSLAAYLWIDPPRSRAELLEDMIAEALAHPRVFNTVGADGAALKGGGAIAAKLL
ncbi:MAG: ATP-grasp domain-containing protein [bacterium]|nr:ATP-grasp domain-containing protein [bacterium]MDE0601815.1 ATP-grasp domain-containing protein [bacterium]